VSTHCPGTAVILLCAAPTPEFLISAMRAGVREVLPAPPPAQLLAAAVERIAAKRGAPGASAPGKVLAFIGSNGGSGATFLATNVGYQLAESRRVLLVDLNLQLGDALTFLHDRKAPVTIADMARDISRLDASFLAAGAVRITPNYSILAAPDEPSQAVEVKAEHVDAILRLAVTQYDFVLLDMARNVDPLAIAALDRAARIFLVLQASLQQLRNGGKLLALFRALDYPAEKMALIVNRHEKGAAIGLDTVRRILGDYPTHTVANAYREVSTSINEGTPLPHAARGNGVARGLAQLAEAINPAPEASRGVLARLFGRA
jgi:pilus assembly protein CpaE